MVGRGAAKEKDPVPNPVEMMMIVNSKLEFKVYQTWRELDVSWD